MDPLRGRLRPALLLVVALLLASNSVGSAAAVARDGRAPLGASPTSTDLTITSFTSSLSNFSLGNAIYLNVTADGGAPPYTYAFAGLPGGCHSQNVSSLYCYPNERNRFEVTATVTDTNGTNASASLPLVVTSGFTGPPVIQSITISPDPVAVGQLATISVVAVTTSSEGFFYWDLPNGCASFNQTPLECLPSEAGEFYIGVQVIDGFGIVVQGHAWLNVTGGSTPSSRSGSSGLSMPVLIAVPLVVVVLVIAVAVLLFRSPRRRSPPIEFRPPPKP